MTINLTLPTTLEQSDFTPRITVIGVGGAGGNAVNNMIHSGLEGVDFLVANSDAQALANSKAERRIQLGITTTHGLGAGSNPEIGRTAAEESQQEIFDHLQDCNMVFITAGLGGGTGTGAAPVIARLTRESGILTVGVVTKPFHFEGSKRMQIAEQGLEELQHYVDTLLIIPNQHLFRVANEKTTFSDAFKMADNVLYSGVRGVTDLMVMPGLINLDFADIRTVMSEMGKAMMGTGEASGERRAIEAAEAAIANPLLEDVSMKGAHGLLINITGGLDMTLFEVDEAANRVRDEVDDNANIIFGSTFDETMEGIMRVSIVSTGIEADSQQMPQPSGIHLVGQTGEAIVRAENKPAVAAMPPAAEPPVPAMPEPTAQPAQAAGAAPAAYAGVAQATSQALAVDTTPTAAPQPAAPPPPAAADRPFIAPPPAEPVTREPAATAPTGGDGGDGGQHAAQRRRNLSLLQKVAGAAKEAVENSQRSVSPAAEAKPEPAVAAPMTLPSLPAAPMPSAAPAPSQSSFSGLNRPAQNSPEEDLLEIPAFLRRQAN